MGPKGEKGSFGADGSPGKVGPRGPIGPPGKADKIINMLISIILLFNQIFQFSCVQGKVDTTEEYEVFSRLAQPSTRK